MTEVTPNLPHFGSFCKYCFMGTLLQGAPCFLFLINKMEQIGQYDHSNNYSKEDDYKVLDTQPFGASQSLSTAECIS